MTLRRTLKGHLLSGVRMPLLPVDLFVHWFKWPGKWFVCPADKVPDYVRRHIRG